MDSRLGWVRAEVDAPDLEEVILGVLAVLQRVLAGNLECFVEGHCRVAEEVGGLGGGGGRQEGGGDGEKLHAVLLVLEITGRVCVQD